MNPSELSILPTRQKIPFTIQFGISAVTPLNAIATLPGDLLIPDGALILTTTIYYTVTVGLNANQNKVQYSEDNLNWIDSLALATPIAVNRTVVSTFGTGRYWRVIKTDGVGTITQVILVHSISP